MYLHALDGNRNAMQASIRCNSNWQFHLYFLKLQAIILCLFLPIYFLFSFSMAGDDRKRKYRKPKGPPKPQTVGASHREKDVNQWKENDMKMCIEEYKRQLAVANNIKALVNRAQIAKSFGISPSTLLHRVSHSKSSCHIEGWCHASGGKRHPHVLKKR